MLWNQFNQKVETPLHYTLKNIKEINTQILFTHELTLIKYLYYTKWSTDIMQLYQNTSDILHRNFKKYIQNSHSTTEDPKYPKQ